MARAPLADRLRHVLEAVTRIELRTTGMSFEDYQADWVTRDVVERNLERISEASRHIPQDVKARHPKIAWRSIADLGNVLRHAYDQIVDERIWILSERIAPSQGCSGGAAARGRRGRPRSRLIPLD
jgi:uncharacterized protein with HEPN domain